MDLSNLRPAKGATHNSKRSGRGQGSGKGGTSRKGHKGAQSRSGYKYRAWFEGGQMPIQRRVPKRGFNNYTRVEYVGMNLDRLQEVVDKYKLDKVDPEILREKGIIAKTELVKILGRGEIKAKVEVSANAFSKSAQAAIEKAGGSVNQI